MSTLEIDMNEACLNLVLSGTISTQSMRQLASEIRLGFDYYKFSDVTVTLDSPGGEYVAMRSLLEVIGKRKVENCNVHVRAGQQCASAAALLLAHGKWGTRFVEPTTRLLFHWARASFKDGLTVTSDVAASLAHGLSNADRQVLECLVDSLSDGAGSTALLVTEIQKRLDSLMQNWGTVARSLTFDDTDRSPRQVVWIRELQRNLKRWHAEPNSWKLKSTLVSTLKSRFEKDTAMDLREAYVLCLIDIVNDVLPFICPESPANSMENEQDQFDTLLDQGHIRCPSPKSNS